MRLCRSVVLACAVAATATSSATASTSDETVVASGPWDVFPCHCAGDPKKKEWRECCNSLRALRVVIARSRGGPSRLRVTDSERTEGAALLEVVRGDGFLGMMPTTVGGPLITLWEGGSAVKILILYYANGQIKPALDIGAKSVPEFVLSSVNSEPAILVAEWESGGGAQKTLRPVRAAIYCWKGDSYALGRTVPWNDRLTSALEVCSSREMQGK